MSNSAEKQTLLHCLLYWEKNTPSGIYLTQPFGDGVVKEYTWQQVGNEVRRIAAYIQSLNLEPKK
jgi:long-chain acyl-CoA synthetase